MRFVDLNETVTSPAVVHPKPGFLYRNRFDVALSAIFLVGLLTIVYFRYMWMDAKLELCLQGSPYQATFSEPKYIMWAVVCTLSVTMAIGLEATLDFFLETSTILKFDLSQRFCMMLIPVIPGFILLTAEESKKLPSVFAFCYTVQCVGSPAPLFSLCHQLFPLHFTEFKMLACYGFWEGCCIFALLSFLDPAQFWAIPCCLLCFALSISILGWVASLWFISVREEIIKRKKDLTLKIVLENLNSSESSCFLYLACHFLIVILVPFIIGVRHNFVWAQVLESDILAMIYSIAVFSVLPSCIPGRIARNALKEKEQTLRTIRTLVRYVSHEIRTPLNIALSGLIIAIHRLPCTHNGCFEPLLDATYACKAATKIIDDLSSMESIGSGLFHTNLGDQDISCVLDLAEQCRNVTDEKNIAFHIADVTDCDGKVICTIDPPQIKQVLQSVVGAATRFVPEKGFLQVEVNFCKTPLPSSLLKTRTPRFLRHFPSTSNSIRAKRVHSAGVGSFERRIAGKVVVKVSGNGFGASRQKFEEVFSEFSCFDANALEGDKGCGLGLWISKEILKRHGGKISFTQEEMNQGTFCIELNGYNLLDPKNSLRKSIHEFAQSISRKISQVSENPFIRQSPHSFYESQPDVLVVQGSSVNSEPALSSMPGITESFEQDVSCNPPSKSHSVSEKTSKLPSACRLQNTKPVLTLDIEQSNKTYQRSTQLSCSSAAEIRSTSRHNCSVPKKPAHSILHKSYVREKKGNIPCCQLRIDHASASDNEDSNASMAPASLSVTVTPPPFFPGSTIRILIVDDIAMNRKMVAQMLRMSQRKKFPDLCLDICEADDGTSAVHKMTISSPFDVVLMDNIMDNLCGPQAAKQMRHLGFKGKIIGVTGNVLKKDIDDFILHGADYVLCKPVGVRDFENVLRNWVSANC